LLEIKSRKMRLFELFIPPLVGAKAAS